MVMEEEEEEGEENHVHQWRRRTIRGDGGGEPQVVMEEEENHARWRWWPWRATGLHPPEQEHAQGPGLPPLLGNAGVGGGRAGTRQVPAVPGDGRVEPPAAPREPPRRCPGRTL